MRAPNGETRGERRGWAPALRSRSVWRTVAAIVIVAGVCTAGAEWSHAQVDDRTITIPAPEEGILYLRSGTPGGVRIHSRHVPPQPAIAEERVERLAAAFNRLGLGVYPDLVVMPGGQVVVLRSLVDGQPVDTLSLAEADVFARTFGADAPLALEPAAPLPIVPRVPLAPAPPATIPPLTAYVERSIFEAGLFRSVQVNFEFDRSELLPSAAEVLNAVADVLRRHPSLRIEVAGHTDHVGAEAYNQRLSERRAEAVRSYLTSQGIESERLSVQGYGESRPLLSNETETGRALNRRVEFAVLSYGGPGPALPGDGASTEGSPTPGVLPASPDELPGPPDDGRDAPLSEEAWIDAIREGVLRAIEEARDEGP